MDPMSDAPGSEPPGPPPTRRAHLEASRRVAQIMRAAEEAAAELREDAERRADARIAEAARAAQARVTAAEEEATELLEDARQQAASLRASAEQDAEKLREDARAQAKQVVDDASRSAAETQRIAEVFADETRRQAEEDARRHVGRARELAGEVLADGTEMSHNLRQLAEFLRRNAETILKDVQRAHRAMSTKLDGSGYEDDRPPAVPDPAPRPRFDDGTEIPEFIPSRPRRGSR